MTATADVPVFRATRGLRQCLMAVAAFAGRHPTFREDIMRQVDEPAALLMVRPVPRLTVPVLDAGIDDHETLTDIIVAGRRDGVPVVLDFEGSYMWADLDFNGLILRALDVHTTCAKRFALESLVDCPIGDLDRTLDAIAEARERWGL